MRRPVVLSSSGALASVLALLLALAPAGAGAQSAPSDDTSTDTSGTPSIAIDPCQIVTSDEASSIANASFGDGVEQSDNESRTCVYGYQTLNVFMVTVAQAPDADTANAEWSQEEAEAEAVLQSNVPPGITISVAPTDAADVSGYDRAALTSGSLTVPSHSINFSGIYLLKGPTFVTYNDLLADNPPPSSDALESEAQTILTRLP